MQHRKAIEIVQKMFLIFYLQMICGNNIIDSNFYIFNIERQLN